jgi:nucleoid-associated protein YgaU
VVKKLAIVLSVVLTGVGLAHCFRKDASPELSLQPVIEPPGFREPVARRLIPAPPASSPVETPPAITTPFRIPLAETRGGELGEPQFEPSRVRQTLSPLTSLYRPADLDEDGEATLDRPNATEAPLSTESYTTHKISDGDTLSSLAARYLGRADRYQEIYNANRDVLRSPDLLPIGKVLKIPSEAQPELTLDSAAEPAH